MTKRGSLITLQHNAMDHQVRVNIDHSTKRATASIQLLSQGRALARAVNNLKEARKASGLPSNPTATKVQISIVGHHRLRCFGCKKRFSCQARRVECRNAHRVILARCKVHAARIYRTMSGFKWAANAKPSNLF